MSRLSDSFRRAKAEGRPIIATFLTVGYPETGADDALIAAMVEGGVDVIELGVPFSDPLAEGPTIQKSSQIALEQGITLRDCLECSRKTRARFPGTPIVLMGYYNPVLSYGLDRFGEEAGDAGVDGVIVVDLPLEEAGPLQRVLRTQGIDLIFLLAPTSTVERIRGVAQTGSGFVYCVSVTGVTGARRDLRSDVSEFLDRVKAETDLPLLVGFGISKKEHVDTVFEMADGVAVGSALINLIEQSAPEAREEKVREFVRGLRGCVEAVA